MQRIPKYTAGMFKKKMPRFGASSIKMPRIPKPPKPRVKKFDEGGDVEETSREEYLRRNPQYLTPEPGLESVYPETFLAPLGALRGFARAAAEKKRVDVLNKIARRQRGMELRGKATSKETLESLSKVKKEKSLTDKVRKEIDNLKEYYRQAKIAPVPMVVPPEEIYIQKSASERKASGGKVKSSCCRGDGIAKKGKTRGKFI